MKFAETNPYWEQQKSWAIFIRCEELMEEFKSRCRERNLTEEECLNSLRHKLFSGYSSVRLDDDEINFLRNFLGDTF